MSEELKVKKSNVLKAVEIARIFNHNQKNGYEERQLKVLFPEAFEEEKKESELEKIVHEILWWNTADSYLPMKRKDWCKKIIDLAKRKVDECKTYEEYDRQNVKVFKDSMAKKDDIKQKLNEL